MTRRILAPREQRNHGLQGFSDGTASTSVPAGLVIEDPRASNAALHHTRSIRHGMCRTHQDLWDFSSG